MKQSSLFCFFLLCLFVVYYKKETFENFYEKNNVLPDKPDDKQFYSCRHEKFNDDEEYPFEKYPNSNYKVKTNQVDLPLKGTYSAFLDTNKIRTYDHFFHSPICEDSYSFETDIESPFRLIPGAFPEEDISVIYEKEFDKDSHDIRNPYYLLGHPEFIQNKILYNDEIQAMFLRVKQGLPTRLDDSSYEGIESPYDP